MLILNSFVLKAGWMGCSHVLNQRSAQCRYLENVPAIVPLLEKEFRNAAKRLEDTQDELNGLNPQKSVFLFEDEQTTECLRFLEAW